VPRVFCGVSRLSVLLSSAVWLLAAVLQSPVSLAQEELCDGTNMVGFQVDADAYPWAVSVLVNGDLRCGGTLIGQDVVLTAAHCFTSAPEVSGEERESFQVRAEDKEETQDKQEVTVVVLRRVRRIMVPKGYVARDASRADLALLWLDSPLLPDKVRPRLAAAAEVKQLLQQHECAFALGRGWNHPVRPGDPAPPDIHGVPDLYIARVPLQQQAQCFEQYKGLANDQLCAGGGKEDACKGDSGGPLFYPKYGKAKELLLIGVVAYGRGCAWQGKLSVYTNVGFYRDWIQDQTGAKK
jgi:secreted trypsin-like serine protease